MATEASHSPQLPHVESKPVASNPRTGSTIERPVHGEYETSRSESRSHETGRSVPGLFADLSRDITTLFRQETELLRAEMGEKVTQVERGVGMAASAGVVALAGAIFVLLAAMFALAFVWPLWASALTVGVVALIAAGGLAGSGKRKVSAQELKPKRTQRSLQSDKQLAKEQFA